MNGQNYLASITKTTLKRCSVIQEVFGGCCVTVAGRGSSPILHVTEVLPDSEYLFLMRGEKCVEEQGGHKI